MRFKTIANRIFALIIPIVILTVVSFASFSYYVNNIRINETIDAKMQESLQSADVEMQFELYKNAVVAEYFAKYAKTMKPDTFDHDVHRDILTENIRANPNTSGGGVCFEPYAFDANSYYFGHILYMDDDDEIHYAYEYAEYADYFNEDWYLKGKQSGGETVWSNVYYDPFSKITMVTASKPFYDENGLFVGMGTADMNIATLQEIVNGISVGYTGNAFIIGAAGEYISFEGKTADETIQTDADEALAKLGKEIIENESGIAVFALNGIHYKVYYTTMDNVQWTLAVMIEQREISSSALASSVIMTAIPVIGLMLIFLSSFIIVRYLRRIINKVNSFADLAASGDFSGQIEVTETDEFGFMEQRLNTMIAKLRDMRRHSIEADERTKLMLDATPLACNLFDSAFRMIDCNEAALKLYGVADKQEYMSMLFHTLSPEYQPDGRLSYEKAHEYLAETFENGHQVFEWLHQKSDRTPLPVEVTLVRVKHGEEYIVAGYTRDLREYKKMTAESEYKDRLLFTVNTIASILLQSEMKEFETNLWRCMGMMAEPVGADRMYIWKNHVVDGELYCTQLYEWSEGAEPQQGKQITISAPYSEVAPTWEALLSSGQSINSMVRDMLPEEQEALSSQGILSILVVPVFLHEQFWGFVGFDDCHRERVFSANEETILRSGSLLVAHAFLRNEMTLDIHAAVEQAQSASRAKSNFLSNMSHEMRTPMNAIIGMTAIGKMAADAQKKDYALGRIEDASMHLLGVINDILDMSKIEANKFDLSEVEFNFEKMLQKVVNVICFRVDEKKQHFSVFLDKDIPRTLIGDDQRLAQVITNLLSNAVKFTDENGSVRLDTRLIHQENDICLIQIEVTDTGIGINSEQFSRLFQSFEQAERSTTRQFGGTGLGLAISKHIVELMGGNIWAESEFGKGSKFAFTVSLRLSADNPNDSSINLRYKNLKVLVVDDEPDTREYFTSIVNQFGITCDTASGGEEALELINRKGYYNLYFVDWSMPGMNGIELSRGIKARSTDKSVIIMISAIEWNVIEKDAKAAGVDRFVPKPLFPSSIVDCINEYLGQQKVTESKENPYESVSFAGYRILLAEDIEINREIVLTLFEPTQLEIDCAENGIEVVRMFNDAPDRYDLILMDIQMPELDGLEATRRIRSLGFPKASEIPIIAMTANVFREDIEEYKKIGMNDHVGKPLDFNDTLEKIAHYLPPR